MSGASIMSEQPTAIVKTDGRKGAVILLCCATIFILSLSVAVNVPLHIASPSLTNYIFGGLGAVLFGLGSVLVLVSLRRDLPRLVLTQKGLRVYNMLGSNFYTWQDVTAFSPRGRFVGMDFAQTRSKWRRMRRHNHRLYGSEILLTPGIYGMTSPGLARLLNDWRDRFQSHTLG